MARLYGQWGKFRSWVNKLKFAAYQSEYERDLTALGNDISIKVRQHISSQSLPWPPLSSVTIRKKGHDRVYIDTREYLNSIDAEVKRKGRFSLELNVEPKGSHSGSGLSMQELAIILEFGTSTTPARPLWRPTFSEVEDMPSFQRLKDLDAKFGFGP